MVGESAVTGGNDYGISYTYAKATSGGNTIRRSRVTFPNGSSVSCGCGSSNLHDGVRQQAHVR